MNTKEYWQQAALDKDVDNKYICDVQTELCLADIGILKGKVLEIGCGVGRLMKDGYYGIDISKNMLAIAKIRKPNCHFKLCINTIPYESNYFDSVYSYLLFQHLKIHEIKEYIKEAYRVLKDGGLLKFQFIVGDEQEPLSNHYSYEQISKVLFSVGFKTVNYYDSKAHELWTIAETKK